MELMLVFCFLSIITFFIITGREPDRLFSTLALFLVASVRLLPAANQIIVSVGRMRFGVHAVNVLYEDLSSYESLKSQYGKKASIQLQNDMSHVKHSVDAPIEDFKSVTLNDVSFSYQNSGSNQLSAINLHINRNEFIGISGESGAGKTTLIEVLLGLLPPTSGAVTVNGDDLIDQNIRSAWMRSIAYIPQTPFLLDANIEANISFEENDQKPALEALKMALEKSQLPEFAIN